MSDDSFDGSCLLELGIGTYERKTMPKKDSKRTMTVWLVVKLTVEVDDSIANQNDIEGDNDIADMVGSNLDYNVTYEADDGSAKIIDTCVEACQVDCPI